MRKPEVEHLPIGEKFSALGSYRSQLATHAESRKGLYERIGTGHRYDPNNIDTLLGALRVGRVRNRVQQSINRIETKINGVDQEMQELVLSDERVTRGAVQYIEQARIHARNGHISWKDYNKYERQLGNIPYKYYKKLIEQNPEDSYAWASLGYWASSKQEKIDCYKKASQLDPKEPTNWYNLGSQTHSLFDAAARDPYGNKQEIRLLAASALSYYRRYLNAQERNPQPNQDRNLKSVKDAIISLGNSLNFWSF